MSTLTFTDGMSFETDGAFRLRHEKDGWYVVGHGELIPVKDRAEGEAIIKHYNAAGEY